MKRTFAVSGAFIVAIVLHLVVSAAVAAEPPQKMGVASESGPLLRADVPEMLRPWIDWALRGSEELSCPVLLGGGERVCAWPSPLELSLQDQGGAFSQRWRVSRSGAVRLPGDREHWPIDVKVDGQAAAVVPVDGGPAIFLAPGEYAISGAFVWKALPESLVLPSDIGLVNLSVKGAQVARPNRDEGGVLWLGREEARGQGEEALAIRVCRLMTDDIPFRLTTRVMLDVSGASREITLENPLPKGFIPMRIASPVPAKLSADGKLHVQARAGSWEIDLVARHEGPVAEIALSSVGGDAAGWPQEEVWAFEAQRDLRVATVEGVPAVDPQQTFLPGDWRHFPAYRVQRGETVRLQESMRGDADPAPDQVHLERELWLDFDGGGTTMRDRITGELHKSWRLEVSPPVALGHVTADGQDLLITSVPGSSRQGVELRQGVLNLSADSRIEGGRWAMPAIAWDHDMKSARATLHVGPGWRLLAAWGADHVPTAWIHQWSLLDIFLVLVLSLAFAKLFGWRWGAVALFGFVLSFQEPDAPVWSWCAVLAATALVRVVAEGRLKTALAVCRVVALVVVIGIAIPFVVMQLRTAVYPSLERMSSVSSPQGQGGPGMMMKGMMAEDAKEVENEALPPPAPPMAGAPLPEEGRAKGGQEGYAKKQEMVQKQDALSRQPQQQMAQQNMNLYYAPGAKVQTGPGIPAWTWASHEITWSGPVKASQRLVLLLVPPWARALSSVLRVLVLALLIGRLLGCSGGWRSLWMRRRIAFSIAAAIAVFSANGVLSVAHAGELPSKELLDELARRLTAEPLCMPTCADFPRLRVEADAASIRLRMQVDAAAPTAVPLPGISALWAPTKISLDEKPAAFASRDASGQVWLDVEAGVHQVVLEGPTGGMQRVTISLPLAPRHVESAVAGWLLEGVREDGRAEGNLELVRSEASPSGAAGAAREDWSQQLPPLVRIERDLSLGLDWRVRTRVVRQTPVGAAVILQVPLLPGETPTTAGLRVEGGKAFVSMTPQASDFSWESTLAPAERLDLVAGGGSSWVELWRLDASPIWHVVPEGIPAVHQRGDGGVWYPEWRPWPGERLTLAISRPEGVPGQTLTIDASALDVTPGVRATDVTLRFTARSSLGGQHEIALPQGAELQSVSIDGSEQPIRQKGQRVALPIVPGVQRFDIKWQQATGIGMFFRTPPIDLGFQSVNAETVIRMPASRWVLFVGGPRLGPAVLVWSLVALLVLAAWGLGRSGVAALRSWQWFLLGAGLVPVSVWAAVAVVGWFVVLEWRRRKPLPRALWFDAVQMALVLWTAVALGIFIAALSQGLLGAPDMQIAGNGSSSSFLKWFADRSPSVLPRAWVISVPLFIYRVAMLGWALWVAFAFIAWIRWAWQCFSADGRWRKLRPIVRTTVR